MVNLFYLVHESFYFRDFFGTHLIWHEKYLLLRGFNTTHWGSSFDCLGTGIIVILSSSLSALIIFISVHPSLTLEECLFSAQPFFLKACDSWFAGNFVWSLNFSSNVSWRLFFCLLKALMYSDLSSSVDCLSNHLSLNFKGSGPPVYSFLLTWVFLKIFPCIHTCTSRACITF